LFDTVNNTLTKDNNPLLQKYDEVVHDVNDFEITRPKVIEIPITQDIYGDTVLDLLLSVKKNQSRLSHNSERFWHDRKLSLDQDEEKMMAMFFKN
jgi:hypothetical protein